VDVTWLLRSFYFLLFDVHQEIPLKICSGKGSESFGRSFEDCEVIQLSQGFHLRPQPATISQRYIWLLVPEARDGVVCLS
jgi:hypothetical protein